jgi:hypothetical protein
VVLYQLSYVRMHSAVPDPSRFPSG